MARFKVQEVAQNGRYDLKDRTLDFAVRAVKLCSQLGQNFVEEHVGKQLLRASTAVMANYAEALNAESSRDFLHKLGLSLKELQESQVWLLLIQKVGLVKPPSRLDPLLDETHQLLKIFATARKTAQAKNKRPLHPPLEP